ncbi:MFS transporter [Castellaniella hirudinis]|uniref:MFS transporter n=1 Tax=Castellaniella hirudinis TaxID=1144617 RepID=A0ABV8RY53_9BURK
MSSALPPASPPGGIESRYAWMRLMVSLALVTIGNVGMYAASIVLPSIQAEFDVSRGDASLPYAATMLGFGIGGILMGRLADRFGVFVPVVLGSVGVSMGLALASMADTLMTFNLVHGLVIGLLGSSALFSPLVADASLWFTRRRGMAVAICMCGNYLAGAVWPPVMQHFVAQVGWRHTYMGIGVFCLATLLPLALCIRRKPPSAEVLLPDTGKAPARSARTASGDRPLGLSPSTAIVLLCIAGVGCCVAMAMPQVQIVAYCGDLGYGATNGANMLSLMLTMGIVSRLVSGWISDRIGGLRTLLLGSILQGLALWLYLFNQGLLPLYIISALFGLFQGGIVPAYAVIVREHFPAQGTGVRVGVVLMATLAGMALGGWMSGWIYDMTLSYWAAFANGIAWNLLNAAIVLFLIFKGRGRLTRLRRQMA